MNFICATLTTELFTDSAVALSLPVLVSSHCGKSTRELRRVATT